MCAPVCLSLPWVLFPQCPDSPSPRSLLTDRCSIPASDPSPEAVWEGKIEPKVCLDAKCVYLYVPLSTSNLAGRQPRMQSKESNGDVEGVSSLQPHQSCSPPSADEAPKNGYLCQRCAAWDDTVHQIVSCCPTLQEQAALSASSPEESLPCSQHTGVAGALPAVKDPCSPPASEDPLFWTWLRSQVESLPQDTLNSFQLENILSTSMEEDCRQEDSVSLCLCSEHQEALSSILSPRPVPLQVEAPLLVAQDFEVLGSAESFAGAPLWHTLTEVETEGPSTSFAASKYC